MSRSRLLIWGRGTKSCGHNVKKAGPGLMRRGTKGQPSGSPAPHAHSLSLLTSFWTSSPALLGLLVRQELAGHLQRVQHLAGSPPATTAMAGRQRLREEAGAAERQLGSAELHLLGCTFPRMTIPRISFMPAFTSSTFQS